MRVCRVFVYGILWLLISCKKEIGDSTISNTIPFISAVDISQYPEINASGAQFYDLNGDKMNMLDILQKYGVNTIRLRLWVNPANVHSSFEQVADFSQTIRSKGFKVWLTLHYSDSWADPSKQVNPQAWQLLSYTLLKDTVYQYTKRVVDRIHPDFIQIGNEINNGLLFPNGSIQRYPSRFIELLNSGLKAVRDTDKQTKIILHYAGIQGADWFFSQVHNVDYDIIGLSYYPIWHGKSLSALQTIVQSLVKAHDKSVVIAETAYPFTLNWNDWTNNIVGLNEQLILPDYPATPQGQQDFIRAIRALIEQIPDKKGVGFCYWGGELIAWKGPQGTQASPWENQALFDFSNRVLPVINVFKP